MVITVDIDLPVVFLKRCRPNLSAGECLVFDIEVIDIIALEWFGFPVFKVTTNDQEHVRGIEEELKNGIDFGLAELEKHLIEVEDVVL